MSINPTPFPVVPAEDATRALNAAQTAMTRLGESMQSLRFAPDFAAALSEAHDVLREGAARAVEAAKVELAEAVRQSRNAR